MIELLQSIFGGMTRYVIMAFIEIAVFWLYVPVFCGDSRQRSLFALRVVMTILLSVLMCIPIAAVRGAGDALWNRILTEILYAAVELGSIFFLFREPVSENAMLFTGLTVARSIAGNLIPLLRNLLGRNDMETISLFADEVPMRDWTIYLLLQLAFLLLMAWMFRGGRKNRSVRLEPQGALLLTGITLLLKCVLAPVARQYQQMSLPLSMVMRVLMMLLYLTVIAARAGLIGKQRLETELRISDELLHVEKKRYAEMRDSIELINMRCHDLKQQLKHLQSKLTEEETAALREAIDIYDNNIHTGSEIVDTVLYQKDLLARSSNVQFTWMCDGSAVTFMEPSRLYALLSNALENAIEAVTPLPENKRVILLHIRREGADAVIETTNYFDPAVTAMNGTAKQDKAHHGFGIKSMRFIAEDYGGTVSTSKKDDMFFLTVHLPIQQQDVL